MKKILILGLAFLMLFVFIGCEKKLPEGIENREFYEDMIELGRLAQRSLENKEEVYIEKNTDLLMKIKKYTDGEIILNSKERQILDCSTKLLSHINLYIIKINENNQEQGDLLRKYIKKIAKEYVELLGLNNYQLKIN